MYSRKVISENISRLSHPVFRFDTDLVESWCAHLDTLLTPEGKLRRSLRREEKDFIRNEITLSKLDFLYWAERHCTIELDAMEGGGLGKLHLWKSQRILLDHIAGREETCIKAKQRGEPVDGILVADHKGGRQVGHTGIARALLVHRMIFYPRTRAMGATVDDDKKQELYDRDKIILDNLPWWMRPSLKYDTKAGQIELEAVGSRQIYQVASQTGGIGQGRQFDVSHITEVASFEMVTRGNPTRLEYEFFPALPQSHRTLCVLESTANGRGNWWHDFTERVRLGQMHRWSYCFIPWYAEPRKYRRLPPPGWSPKATTLAHAKYAHDTSAEFMGGLTTTLAKDNLYWWETSREEAIARGTLNIFLSNYAATPEESFQHSGRSAFDATLLSELRAETFVPSCYEVVGV